MQSCTVENWTLESLAKALTTNQKENKRIVVPMFQRGKRWKSDQQETFIDSVIKGYPIGTLLFYETNDVSQRTYILVDGLQRSNCVKQYIENPTEFFQAQSISNETCKSILDILDCHDTKQYAVIRNLINDFVKEGKTFKNLQFFPLALDILVTICSDSNPQAADPRIKKMISVISSIFEERQELHERISSTVVPVVVYHGSSDTLPEIFERINSKGTPLDTYEIYAASWPVDRKFAISNDNILNHVSAKYESLRNSGFQVDGYQRDLLYTKKEVNAFEYLFGLGKWLAESYGILAERNFDSDVVNPVGFELVDACLNDSNRIRVLYNDIYRIQNFKQFENALVTAIEFVQNVIAPILLFKGNTRKKKGKTETKPFHTRHQILSTISTTFREMYPEGNVRTINPNWHTIKERVARNLLHYYVYDIINDYWGNSGDRLMRNAAKPNRYLTDITPQMWRAALERFFNESMQRKETDKVLKPRYSDYVFLNCIYLNHFSALEQLSIDRYDVEHIAPQKQMKRFLELTKGEGLPISCIANLCYLPEHENRSKGDSNFYQDKKYLKHITLAEVESKYSFTSREDLEWMDMPYENSNDFDMLKESYTKFCTHRFEELKKRFCKSMGIDYDALIQIPSIETPTPSSDTDYLEQLQEHFGKSLIHKKHSIHVSPDNQMCVSIRTCTPAKQGPCLRYWFTHAKSTFESVQNIPEKYIAFVCNDSNVVLVYPSQEIEEILPQFNSSQDESGNPFKWHLVFFRETDGHMLLHASRPPQDYNADSHKI